MNKNPFNHIDLPVIDIKSALAFYSRFLPTLGFTDYYCDEEKSHIFSVPSEEIPSPFLNETINHEPNANRIAFGVKSKEEGNRIAQIIKEAHAKHIEGPCECPEYTPCSDALSARCASTRKMQIIETRIKKILTLVYQKNTFNPRG